MVVGPIDRTRHIENRTYGVDGNPWQILATLCMSHVERVYPDSRQEFLRETYVVIRKYVSCRARRSFGRLKYSTGSSWNNNRDAYENMYVPGFLVSDKIRRRVFFDISFDIPSPRFSKDRNLRSRNFLYFLYFIDIIIIVVII